MNIGSSIIAAGALLALGGTARAELSCAAFTRAYVLHDADVLQQAAVIAIPLAKARAVSTGAVLMVIARDCQALPDDTVEALIATHLKIATPGAASGIGAAVGQ